MDENQELEDKQVEQSNVPADAKEDDLTVDEIVQVDDDDFEKYHSGEITAAAIREKYNFKEKIEDDIQSEEQNDTQENNEADDTSEQQEAQPSEETQYGEYWKKVSAPFKANGTMYQPRSPEDIINLMQKGANYTQKMQKIAPYKKAFETLSKNNIDDQELNFLIDLKNGNKDAIKALLKRNKIDSMELSDFDDSPNHYIPNNHIVSEQEIEIQDILSDISNNREKIEDVLYNKWDEQSRQTMIQNPKLIRLLNEELELGRFDEIQHQVESIKMFGNNNGMSDLDLYSALARQYTQHQQAEFQKASQNISNVNKQQASKKAAAPSGRTTNTGKGKSFTPQDILSMPEEEFMKLDLDKMLAK